MVAVISVVESYPLNGLTLTKDRVGCNFSNKEGPSKGHLFQFQPINLLNGMSYTV